MTRLRFASDGPPRDPRTWSGTPARLIAALEANGATIDAIDVAGRPTGSGPGWFLDRARATVPAVRAAGWSGARRHSYNIALASPRVPRQRARRHLTVASALPPADGLIQTCGYVSPDAGPTFVVTDMTFHQAVTYDWKGHAAAPFSWQRAGELHAREVFAAAAACCAASSWAAESIIDDYGVAPNRVHVVGLGSEPTTVPRTREWNTPRFAFVGLDWARKNGALLVECFTRFRETVPGAELDLVGDHPKVTLPGVRGHGVLPWDASAGSYGVMDVLRRATCLVLPSELEPFGLVHVEAGMVGIPSIGTTRGGAASAIGPGGILVPPGDANALEAALHTMADSGTAQRLGAAARRHAATLTWDAVAVRILKLVAGAHSDQ